MMAITHAALAKPLPWRIATAGVSLFLGTAAPLPLGLAVLGSQLPDIDTTTSLIGQICFPISSWIEDRYPHRSITHSLVATVTLTAISLGIGFALGAIKPWLALPLGHVLACFADCFTRQGVQLFWPVPVWAISIGNPKRRICTGGPGEYWVLSIAIAILVTGLWLAGAGSVQTQVNQGLGLRDGAIATYNHNAATAEVYADIIGVWSHDRTDATGSHLILGNEGSEFIVTDGQGVYKTGESIIAEKLTTKAGELTQRSTKTLTLNDQDIATALGNLMNSYPGNRIYLSGSIVVDFPEEIQIVSDGRQLEIIAVSGESVTLIITLGNRRPLSGVEGGAGWGVASTSLS
ncbi:metal-dependent hydrolase [Adonisia turfae]|uniref:metal-dependent hydrolase n=1 Tax=Adonisia turfae TaxID=2950184 RepID=UPI002029A7A8|nr:metal-dependent hydrolase [Adonisia turfae]